MGGGFLIDENGEMTFDVDKYLENEIDDENDGTELDEDEENSLNYNKLLKGK